MTYEIHDAIYKEYVNVKSANEKLKTSNEQKEVKRVVSLSKFVSSYIK